jgi:hypothetical protein
MMYEMTVNDRIKARSFIRGSVQVAEMAKEAKKQQEDEFWYFMKLRRQIKK